VGKADLHIHTRVSDGMATIEETLAYVEHETDLDVIAITDHEDVRASFLARELAAKRGYRVQVVPGAEITTLHGHLLALFVEDSAIPSFRTVDRTIALVHRLGGVAVIPHPMSWLTRSIGRRPIERLVAASDPELRIDALEESQSPAGSLTRAKVVRLNGERYHLPRVGNSDAHFLVHIGASYTEFDGSDAEALKAAIQSGATTPGHRHFVSPRELGLRAVLHQTCRGLMATPRKMAARPFEARRARL
jgi:predicted metal-dependent phosphoesterase TrpH